MRDVTSQALRSTLRNRSLVRVRDEVAYRLHTDLGLCPKDIGALLGGRGRTTIIDNIRRFRSRLTKKAVA